MNRAIASSLLAVFCALSAAEASKCQGDVDASCDARHAASLDVPPADGMAIELLQTKSTAKAASSSALDDRKHAGVAASAQGRVAETGSQSKIKTSEHGSARSITVQPTNQTGIMIAPFGKEDTARELQGNAARTQDTLVDAIENAEVAEIKRSVFRALTRLRAAEIKEFDTIARLETQALDEYNDNHHFRGENPLQYISSAEPRVPEDKYISFHD